VQTKPTQVPKQQSDVSWQGCPLAEHAQLPKESPSGTQTSLQQNPGSGGNVGQSASRAAHAGGVAHSPPLHCPSVWQVDPSGFMRARHCFFDFDLKQVKHDLHLQKILFLIF
jgi:hypothetical protein